MKGSISYKVKKQRPPTLNQTLQEMPGQCRAYAIHGHSRTENQKHLTALKSPVIYQEAMKAGPWRIPDLQIKTLKLEQTAIFSWRGSVSKPQKLQSIAIVELILDTWEALKKSRHDFHGFPPLGSPLWDARCGSSRSRSRSRG